MFLSFNRTFMELKLWSRYFFCSRISFQSYLYGIEILAFGIALDSFPMFQSYLYGIEMMDEPIERHQKVAFQSYLYGIEIKR